MHHDDPSAASTRRLTINPARRRGTLRDRALQSALAKRRQGVPSYTIAEAAALCSVSQEHLYRMVRAGGFPAVRMRSGEEQGRYIVPARAVEDILSAAATGTDCLDAPEWTSTWNDSKAPGGAA